MVEITKCGFYVKKVVNLENSKKGYNYVYKTASDVGFVDIYSAKEIPVDKNNFITLTNFKLFRGKRVVNDKTYGNSFVLVE